MRVRFFFFKFFFTMEVSKACVSTNGLGRKGEIKRTVLNWECDAIGPGMQGKATWA